MKFEEQLDSLMDITKRNKIYFASDCHLGVPDYNSSLEREKRFVKWLDSIKNDAKELYLLGDIFDFWFEYKTVIPKGYTRLLGKLAELSDAGIKIHYFTGNHDMWMFGYLQKELNVQLYRKPIILEIEGKKLYIAHGDGLGPGDHKYKFIKKVFANKFCQWLFARFHPNFGIGLANYFSKKSRIANGITDEIFLGENDERLIQFIKQTEKENHYDFYIFGHRHLPIDILIGNSRYINLGEWVKNNSYAVWENENVFLKYFNE
ncbi:MAG TPA: UDP-2,3-diacylglucosamine diphosphatase [Bacteroidales bacterium]|nr:UDP-2,3-diacylglucosamine diphosphatase [Bacteroidales bacterium]HPS15580.1 UDP-2,3-diacylglucosamine diphosphatase [Bacteroidales bacterium]